MSVLDILSALPCQLPDEIKEGIVSYTDDIQELLSNDLISIILYGGVAKGEYVEGQSNINILVVLEKVDVKTLDKLVEPYKQAVRTFGIDLLIMSMLDLETSTDVFPIRFLDIQNFHINLFGKEVLKELKIARDHLRLQCEQNLKTLQINLLQFYLQRIRYAEMIEGTLTNTISSHLIDLATLINLKNGKVIKQKDEIIDSASTEFGLDSKLLKDLLMLKEGGFSYKIEELKILYDSYITSVQKSAQIADKI